MNVFESADIILAEQGASPGDPPIATLARCLIGPDNQPYLKVNEQGHVVIKDPVTGNWVRLFPSALDSAGDSAINLQQDQA
jgi:hypothetical protein